MSEKTKVVSKEGFFNKSKTFFRGVWAELKKVYWPTKNQVVRYTGIVLGAIFVIGFAIWIVDSVLSFLLGLII